MLNLALMYFHNAKETKNQDKFKEASKWFRTLILEEPQMAEPHFYLGQLHESGNGVTRDLKSAFHYYRKGAKLDHVESLVKCGDFLYSGRGLPSFNASQTPSISVRKDRLEAFKCYKKASDMGNSRGMNNCGLMYEGGFEGNPPDLESAEQMYKSAHKIGNLDATINLAFYYLNVSQTQFLQPDLTLWILTRNWATKMGNQQEELCSNTRIATAKSKLWTTSVSTTSLVIATSFLPRLCTRTSKEPISRYRQWLRLTQFRLAGKVCRQCALSIPRRRKRKPIHPRLRLSSSPSSCRAATQRNALTSTMKVASSSQRAVALNINID